MEEQQKTNQPTPSMMTMSSSSSMNGGTKSPSSSTDDCNQNIPNNKTVVRLCGSSCSTCGYCSGKRCYLVDRHVDDSSKSYGLLCSSLSASTYLALIERGWRRSGQHLYKPDNWDSCCPALTIRLPVSDFEPSKSQRRVLKKMERALSPETVSPNGTKNRLNHGAKNGKNNAANNNGKQPTMTTEIPPILEEWTRSALHEILQKQVKVKYKLIATNKAITTVCAAIAGPSKGAIQRGKLAQHVVEKMRQRHGSLTIEAHLESGQIICTLPDDVVRFSQQSQPSLLQPMESESTNPDKKHWFQKRNLIQPYHLTMTTIPARDSFLQPDVHQLYFLYQQEVHDDPSPFDDHDEEADWGEASDAYVARTVQMVRDTYPKLRDEALSNLLASLSCFYRFLVESPLETTYHQQYRINGILIAVGVVDILPNRGLSSVYAFYEPTFAHSHCPLGKFLILREIEYCQSHHLPNYYLGYYIHSCPKMKYKAEYKPSQILCPTTFSWVDAEPAQALLEASPKDICTLATTTATTSKNKEHPGVEDNTTSSTTNVVVSPHEVLLDVGNFVTVDMLNAHGQGIVQPLVEEFIHQVGPQVSRQCVLKLV